MDAFDQAVADVGQCRTARAFNRGSDARLRGEPMTANPYPSTTAISEHAYWRMGWQSVDQEWGSRSRPGRYWIRPLPLVLTPLEDEVA